MQISSLYWKQRACFSFKILYMEIEVLNSQLICTLKLCLSLIDIISCKCLHVRLFCSFPLQGYCVTKSFLTKELGSSWADTVGQKIGNSLWASCGPAEIRIGAGFNGRKTCKYWGYLYGKQIYNALEARNRILSSNLCVCIWKQANHSHRHVWKRRLSPN